MQKIGQDSQWIILQNLIPLIHLMDAIIQDPKKAPYINLKIFLLKKGLITTLRITRGDD